MIKKKIKKFKLQYKSIEELKKLNLKSIGLRPSGEENIYSYESKKYNFLNYKITPKIFFLITFVTNTCIIKLKRIEISEISKSLKLINLVIEVKIYKHELQLHAERYISIEIIEKQNFLKLLPNELVSKLLENALEIITNRFDKKFINKIVKPLK
tara:strand:- start:32 stop:496 length:465 start_codon:yes stop_codon:yes gene_type:complete